MTGTAFQRPALEVADVIRQHGAAFLQRYGNTLSGVQRQALRDLARCRTAALGGHVEHCLDCGHERIAYNSCRNRHCPKCQALARACWLQQQAEHLLPVEYHHVVFTLPAEVGAIALANPAIVYDLLIRSAAATLREVAANPQRLGAVVGVLMVLHTWGQNLHHHPHVHCVVTGGGLSCNAQGVLDASPTWRSCRPGFFLPVRVLSRVFRGKFVAGLRALLDAGKLKLPPSVADAAARVRWLATLYAKEWVVYAKPPFGGPEQVLKYLARYTHRVAISNARLLELQDGRVTFRYKDYADDQRHKVMTLSAEEFLHRFVQHVLPKGFVKIRHYGLLANAQRAARLHTCRRLLLVVNVAAVLPRKDTAAIAPAEPRCCERCGSTRLVYREWQADDPGRAPRRGTVRSSGRSGADSQRTARWASARSPCARGRAKVGAGSLRCSSCAALGCPPARKGLHPTTPRGTIVWPGKSDASSNSHSRWVRGSVQRESIPSAPPTSGSPSASP